MHPANDCVDFLNTGDNLRLLYGVDNATVAARGNDHQPLVSNEEIGSQISCWKSSGMKVFEFLSGGSRSEKATKPIDDASLHLAWY